MLRFAPLFLVVVFGMTGVVVFGCYALIDWNALQAAYADFSAIARGSPDLADLFAAEAQQNIHRLNLFAEGVWTLQSAILAAIGLHGICTSARR